MTRPSSRRRAVPIWDALRFTFAYWRRQPWLTGATLVAMMAATLADVVTPVFAGRLVDAATGRDEAAVSAGARGGGLAAGTRGLRHPGPHARLLGHGGPDVAHHGGDRRGSVRARAAILDRLARQQLRRLDRAQGDARHVGARPSRRHADGGPAPLAGRAGRLDRSAGLAMAADRPRDPRWRGALCGG